MRSPPLHNLVPTQYPGALPPVITAVVHSLSRIYFTVRKGKTSEHLSLVLVIQVTVVKLRALSPKGRNLENNRNKDEIKHFVSFIVALKHNMLTQCKILYSGRIFTVTDTIHYTEKYSHNPSLFTIVSF